MTANARSPNCRNSASAAVSTIRTSGCTRRCGRLPPKQRAALVLRYVHDLSIEQTAAELGCSVGNVKSQTARGLATLREAYGEPVNSERA